MRFEEGELGWWQSTLHVIIRAIFGAVFLNEQFGSIYKLARTYWISLIGAVR